MKSAIVGLFVMGLMGCDGTTGNNAAAFIGSWTSSSSETEVCTTGTNVTPLNDTLPVVAGSSPADVITESPSGCNLTWTVNSNVATLKSGQVCTVPGSVGGTWTATFASGSLALNGKDITLADQGTGVLLINGATVNCTFTQTGSWIKN